MATGGELRARIDAIVSGPGPGVPAPTREGQGRRFSSYVDEDVDRAAELASRFMAVADAKGGLDGLSDAVDDMERAVGEETPGTVAYAVKLFFTHYPDVRSMLHSDGDSPTEPRKGST